MSETILVTSALPYANGALHFGHLAGAYLPADVYVRFMRLIGNDVLYICGSDEYGVAITLSAELAGRSPKAHVDHYHPLIQEFFRQCNIQFDHYSRTTWAGHAAVVQAFFLHLLKGGYIEKRKTEQLFSERENRFLADRYVIGTCPHCKAEDARGDECLRCGAAFESTDLINPRSRVTGAPLVFRETEHYFLRFDLFKSSLQAWLSQRKWKDKVLHFAARYVDDLKPRCISRDSDWGVPVPLEEAKGKVLYVWFDAPIGYISITQEWAKTVKKDPNAWKRYWLDPATRYVQFIGKDNIPFHAIFFPAMCLGQTQPYKLVDDLPANDFLNLEGKQFSKSSGWTIDLTAFFHKFTADQIRYYLAVIAPENGDSEFSWKEFQLVCNTHLVGKWGNFANRILVFALRAIGDKVPAVHLMSEVDKIFVATIDRLTQEIDTAYRTYSLRRATQGIAALCDAANTYFDHQRPWQLMKEGKKAVLETCLCLSLNCLKRLAIVSSPLIPDAALKVWRFLGFSGPILWDLSPLPLDQKLSSPEILFKKIEDSDISEGMEQIAALKAEEKVKGFPEKKGEIDLAAFQACDLRVVQILSAEPVPKSKKLLKLTLDLGFEKRIVVSGIAEAYPTPSELVGKKVVLIINLKPITLFGIESQGMLLCAGSGKFSQPLFLSDNAPLGDLIR